MHLLAERFSFLGGDDGGFLEEGVKTCLIKEMSPLISSIFYSVVTSIVQGCQIESFSIRFSIQKVQKAFDSIQLTIQFDRKPLLQCWKKLLQSWNWSIFKGDTPGCQKQLAKSFVITLCEIFTFYCLCFGFFVSKLNRIVSKIGGEKLSIRSGYELIRFAPKHSIR